MGAALCMILASWGSAWGTWRAGLGVCHMGVDHPAGIIKNVVPIVMAGVLGIYGLIVAVIITQAVSPPNGGQGNMTSYSSFNGYTHVRLFWSGVLLCCVSLLFWTYLIYISYIFVCTTFLYTISWRRVCVAVSLVWRPAAPLVCWAMRGSVALA